jgi:hypothetical protein
MDVGTCLDAYTCMNVGTCIGVCTRRVRIGVKMEASHGDRLWQNY